MLALPTALTLALAAGLQPLVTLALLALAQRGGGIHLATPYAGVLGHPAALPALALLALGDLLLGRTRRGREQRQRLRLPLALGAGALVATTQAAAVPGLPGPLLVAFGALLAALIHRVRPTGWRAVRTLRPVAALAGGVEGSFALLVGGAGLVAPGLGPALVLILGVLLLGPGLVGGLLVLRLARHGGQWAGRLAADRLAGEPRPAVDLGAAAGVVPLPDPPADGLLPPPAPGRTTGVAAATPVVQVGDEATPEVRVIR